MADALTAGDAYYDDQIAEAYVDDELPLPAGYPGANSARAWVTDAELQEFLNGIGDSTRERVELLIN